jgi:chorismate mutase/prephenate dehydratase
LQSKKEVATLGSDFLASCCGLSVAVSNVHDYHSNMAKFHMISKCERVHDGEGRTAVLFRIDNDVGRLADFLNLFKEEGVNIASLHSLPIWNNKEMAFYCEFDSYSSDLPMYSRIQKFVKRYSMIGTYDRHLIS